MFIVFPCIGCITLKFRVSYNKKLQVVFAYMLRANPRVRCLGIFMVIITFTKNDPKNLHECHRIPTFVDFHGYNLYTLSFFKQLPYKQTRLQKVPS